MTTGNKQLAVSYAGSEESIDDANRKFIVPWVRTYYLGKKWAGSDDPGYQLKIERGLSATNSYSREHAAVPIIRPLKDRIICRAGTGFKTITQVAYGDGDVVAVTWDEAGTVKNLTNLAMSKLYGVLQEIANPVGGLELLAEFRDTVRMVKNPAKNLGDYLNRHLSKQVKLHTDHKSRNIAIWKNSRLTPKQRLKRLAREANRWSNLVAQLRLEYKFGWEPLVKTVGEAAQAATEVFPSRGVIKTFRKSSRTIVVKSTTTTIVSGRSGLFQTDVEEYEYVVTLVMRVRWSGQFDGMGDLEQLYNRSGFLRSQLIPLAWELAPLSVFVDYFANVGEILSACMTETKDVISVDRLVRRRLIRRRTLTPRSNIFGYSDPLFRQEGLVVGINTKYTREKWAMSIPPLRFTTPADSLVQTLNLAAFLKLGFFK